MKQLASDKLIYASLYRPAIREALESIQETNSPSFASGRAWAVKVNGITYLEPTKTDAEIKAMEAE